MNRVMLFLVVWIVLAWNAELRAQVSQVVYYAPSGAIVQAAPVATYYSPAPTTYYAPAPVYYSAPRTVYYSVPMTAYYAPVRVVASNARPLVGNITRVRYAPTAYVYPATATYYQY
jgi:hypothetical protein